jgi:hypothetical protein
MPTVVGLLGLRRSDLHLLALEIEQPREVLRAGEEVAA